MSSAGTLPLLSHPSTWLHRWIYYLAACLMFAGVAVRSILVFQHSPIFINILTWLAVWLLIFIVTAWFDRQLSRLSILLIGLEIYTILQLLQATRTDFFAFLFAVSSMQAMQKFTGKEATLILGLTTLLTFLMLYQPFGIFYALGTAVVFFGGSLFLLVYIGSTRRARFIQGQQQVLVGELEQANRQLESYAQTLQQLAAGHERQRLARELHDSVTQTIFSMTLTTQSALLLFEQDRSQVYAQLERLNQLAQSTLAEMQTLITKLAPEAKGGFVSALQQHLDERQRFDNLSVCLEVQGSQLLTIAEEQSLFRIVQEALNNIIKHATVNQATVRLNLVGQPWLEIADQGIGFDAQRAGTGSQVGLVSMRERAGEIGWSLQVDSAPGKGTRIRIERKTGGEKKS